jgi:hypothetical protein
MSDARGGKREDGALIDVVARVIELRRTQDRISPAWIATEAMLLLDPEKQTQRVRPLVYLASHLQLRQIARELCRKSFEGDEDSKKQHELFPDLQWRYPSARSKEQEEPEYVRLELLAQTDVTYNVARLRKEGRAKLRHADSLEAWGLQRFPKMRKRRRRG